MILSTSFCFLTETKTNDIEDILVVTYSGICIRPQHRAWPPYRGCRIEPQEHWSLNSHASTPCNLCLSLGHCFFYLHFNLKILILIDCSFYFLYHWFMQWSTIRRTDLTRDIFTYPYWVSLLVAPAHPFLLGVIISSCDWGKHCIESLYPKIKNIIIITLVFTIRFILLFSLQQNTF